MENITIERKKTYAIVHLHHGKFNLINSIFIQDFIEVLRDLRNDDLIRGIIIAGLPGYFSLGLHIKEVAFLPADELYELGTHISLVNYEIVTFPKPVVAAVTGHAPAGGTLLASGADYRVMADGPDYIFGLNEVGANISLPYDVAQGMIFWLGEGKAYPYLIEGKLMSPQEALEIGMVNELCPLDNVVNRAEIQMIKYLATSSIIFSRVKKNLRQKWVAILEAEKDNAYEEWGVFWQTDEVQRNLKQFAERLSK